MSSAPEGDLAAEFYVGLGRLVRSLRREHGDHRMGVGLLSALSQLARSGPMRATALAEAENVAPASMTRIVTMLEERALARRTPDPSDGRAQLVEVTDAGRTLLREGTEVKLTALRRRIAALSKDERAAVAAALPALEKLSVAVSAE